MAAVKHSWEDMAASTSAHMTVSTAILTSAATTYDDDGKELVELTADDVDVRDQEPVLNGLEMRPGADVDNNKFGFVPDSDDEEPSFGRQILPVARLPADFNGAPQDGMQYLFTVRRDAKRLPNVTRAAGWVHQPSRAPVVASPSIPTSPVKLESSTPPPRSRLPSEDWRSAFLSRFRNFRKNVAQPTIGTASPASPAAPGLKTHPEKKARDAWYLFIAGRPAREWDPPKRRVSRRARQRAHHWSVVSERTYARDVEMGGAGMQEHLQLQTGHGNDVYAERNMTLVYSEDGELVHVGDSGAGPGMGESTEAQMIPPAPPAEVVPEPEQEHHSFTSRQPTPSLLRLLDNAYCVHLLMFFAHWIELYVEQAQAELDKDDNGATGYDSAASTPPMHSTMLPILVAPPTPPIDPAIIPAHSPTLPHLTQTHARWIFALLARVDEHVTADEMHHLRMLARACMALVRLRILELERRRRRHGPGLFDGDGIDVSKVVEAEVEDARAGDVAPFDERACWIIIATIAGFWAQWDLWMDAESMLTSI